MFFKCSIRLCIRRRRSLFLIFTLICFSSSFIVLHRSSSTNSSFVSNPKSTLTNGSCSTSNLDEIRLNCSGDPAESSCAQQQNLCNNLLSIYKNLFVRTRSVVVNRKFAKGKRIGGENIHEVFNQPENDEYFRFEKNFLQLRCDRPIPTFDFGRSHLNDIFSSLTTFETCPMNLTLINDTTIAINRYDYANLYHTLTDIYSVYFVCRFFLHDPKSVRILFLDAHPKSNLDIFWSTLFHSFSRLGQMNSDGIFFRELIWSPPQAKSEIDVTRNRRTSPSFFDDFREHVLQQFNVNSQVNRTWPCETINVYFLLRKNYVAHPRNPSGRISRQLSNEKQVIEFLTKKFDENPSIRFVVGHFELLSIEEQLKIISRTDLLVGIHGAGLTHVLFMQSNRTVVELAPPTWQNQIHFELMATMNKLNYHRCSIHDGLPSTPQKIFECLQQKILQMCPSSKTTGKSQ